MNQNGLLGDGMLGDLGVENTKKVDLVQYCVSAVEYTEDQIRVKKSQWMSNWMEYLGNIDYADKADWQSRGHLPKFKQAVRVAQKTLKSAIIKADDFFTFKGQNAASIEIQEDITKGVKKVLEQSKFKQRHFGNGVFRALLESLTIFKTWVQPLTQDPIAQNQEFEFPVTVVSAFDLFIDPTCRRKFIIHRIKKDLSDFRKDCQAGVYDKNLLEQITSDFEYQDDEMKEKVRQGLIDAAKPAWRKEVELLEFWGSVDDDDGDTAYENVTFTVVNRRYLGRSPQKNPFEHGLPPFVFGPIFEIDGSEYPETFGDQVLGICTMIDESYNLAIDAAAAESIKAFVLNMDYLHNPTELKAGIYPGKVVRVTGVPAGTQPLQDINLGRLAPENLQLMGALDREFQNSTGINEFISGIVSGASGTTATEVKQKSAQSMGFLQATAEDMEDNVLEPFVFMVYKNIMQYNPEIFGDRVNSIPKDEIYVDYEVKGMSKILQQADEFGKLMQWVGMFSQTPAGQKINWDQIAKDGARLVSLDPQRVFLDEAVAPQVPGQNPTMPEQVQSAQASQLQALQGGKT